MTKLQSINTSNNIKWSHNEAIITYCLCGLVTFCLGLTLSCQNRPFWCRSLCQPSGFPDTGSAAAGRSGSSSGIRRRRQHIRNSPRKICLPDFKQQWRLRHVLARVCRRRDGRKFTGDFFAIIPFFRFVTFQNCNNFVSQSWVNEWAGRRSI